MFRIEKEFLEQHAKLPDVDSGFYLLRKKRKALFPVEAAQKQARCVMKMRLNEHEITCVDFVNLTEEEQLTVWRWRNHKNIRQWMYHPEPFSFAEHLTFIQSLVRRQDKQYFLIKNQQKYSGVIDFVNIDVQNQSCAFGLYVNPESEVSGIGSLLETIGIYYAFNVLKLETITVDVFSNNKRSLALHKKFGFKITEKRSLKEKEIFFMQLDKRESAI